ncbi:MAG: DEAD/DEAH box helicase [Planctomycetes bacterium]|nr:DEAD/DEAH box helicase [Planctomycetota bacterium]
MSERRGRGKRRPSGGSPSSAAAKAGPRAEPLKPTTEAPAIESFREWPLVEDVQRAIEAMGITKPTPVQKLAIGPVLEGRDVIAKAETGTGKTLAFGAPMMSKIEAGRATVLGLVLCPTRELAQQVCGVLEKLGAARGVKTALVVGGEPMPPQINALKAGAQVVVGTPGRVIDLYGQRFLSFPWTEFVVLDEADEMLEIGFIDDVRKILSYTPEERQTLLFSATYPSEVLKLARESTRNPVEIATAAGIATVKNIDQSWIAARREDRALLLTRIIEQSASDDVFLVFCDRRTEVDQLFRQLGRLPFSVKSLHGGYDQAARFRVMSAFRTGEVKALIATDVAARGLDVHQVSHVVNFSVPRDASTYTHRIGRTGRAGRDGAAITIVGPEHVGRWEEILRDTKWQIREEQAPDRTGRQRVRDERRGPPREREEREERGFDGPRRDEREPSSEFREPRGDARRSGAPSQRAERRPDSADSAGAARRDRRDETSAPRREESSAPRRDERGPRRGAPRAEPTASSAPQQPSRRPAAARDAAPEREPSGRAAREQAAPRREERSAARREERPPAREPRGVSATRAPNPTVGAGASERPKRAMSTRERLQLERERAQSATRSEPAEAPRSAARAAKPAAAAPSGAPPAGDGDDSAPRRRRGGRSRRPAAENGPPDAR